MKIITHTCLASSLFFASLANAQFAAYDGFETPGDYTADTNVIGQNATAGTGDWSGAWVAGGTTSGQYDTVTSSLGYTDTFGNVLTTSAGSLDKTGGNTIITRDFGAAFGTTFSNTSNDLWFSLIVDVTATTAVLFTTATSNSTGTNGPGFDIDGGELIAKYNNETGAAVALSLGNNFILGRVQQDAGTGGADVLDIWINPGLIAAPVIPAASSTERDFDVSTADNTYVRSKGGGDTIIMDEYRIGTTFESVAPATIVPEPSTYALIAGMLAFSMLVLRRRKA